MIVQIGPAGALVDARTGAEWFRKTYDENSEEVPFSVVLSQDGNESILHAGTKDDCSVFLNSLARRLGAVKWNSEKRFFESVGGPNE